MLLRLLPRLDGAAGSRWSRRPARVAIGITALLGAWASTGAAQSAAPAPTASDRAARLSQVDAALAAVEAQLSERTVRVASDGEAGRRGVGGTVVVLLRADAPNPRPLASATLALDETQVDTRAYYAAQREALGAGAADELYRGTMLMVPHALALTVVAGGQPMSQTVTVTPAGDGRPTYVEFAVRDGGLDVASWLGGSPPGPR